MVGTTLQKILQSVGLLWTRDRPVADTSTWQDTTLTTNSHAPGGNGTRDPTRRPAADPRLLDRSATGTV